MNKDKLIIIHNPRCGKSRNALSLIQSSKIDFEIREYLKDPLTKAELKSILRKLNLTALEFIRKNEKDFIDNFKGKSLTEEEWIAAMMKFPKLIQRPILLKGDKATIARSDDAISIMLEP